MAVQVSTILPPILVGQAAAVAAQPVFGLDKPLQVVNRGDFVEILIDPDQEDKIASFIIRQLDAAPGAIRVNLTGVVLKVLARKYWGYAAGLAGASFALGNLFHRGKKRSA